MEPQPGSERCPQRPASESLLLNVRDGRTLAHEITHSLLHWTADGKKITTRDGKQIDKQQRELEAEATAYVVGSYFGVQSPSDFYLASYRVTPAMLLEAVETIAATVKTILSGCQEPAQLCAA